MKKKLFILLFIALMLVGCNKQNAIDTESDEIKTEVYYTVLNDEVGYVTNQSSNLILMRILYKDSQDNYLPYYNEITSELLADNNKELFLNNEDKIKETLVEIYNGLMEESKIDYRINVDTFNDIDFKLQKDGEDGLSLAAYKRVDLNFEDINKAIEKDGKIYYPNRLNTYDIAINLEKEMNGINWLTGEKTEG